MISRTLAVVACIATAAAFAPVARPSSSHAQLTKTNMVIPGDSAAEFVALNGIANSLSIYKTLITATILSSWFPQARQQPLLQPLFIVTDPFLNLFRGLGLNFGGLDLSILPAFFLLGALTNAVPALSADLSLLDPSVLL